VFLFSLLAVAGASAEEPVQPFLDGLRLRGFYDEALDYLDRLESRGNLPEDLSETIAYERAVTYALAARNHRDLAVKKRRLVAAQDELSRFLADHPDHRLAEAAKSRLGAILVDQAQILLDGAPTPMEPAQRRARLAQARAMFERARPFFKTVQDKLREKLLEMPRRLDPVADAGKIAERDRLRSQYIQTQLMRAAIEYKIGLTYDPDEEGRRATVQQAAAAYSEMYSKYRTRLAGLYARLYEGRCWQTLGDHQRALRLYEELLELPHTAPALVQLKTEVLQSALECWLDGPRKDYDQAIRHGEPWAAVVAAEKLSSENVATVLRCLARAYRLKADSLAGDSPEMEKCLTRAHALKEQAAELERELETPGEGD